MTGPTLTREVLEFLLRAIASGHVETRTACAVVTPWVEGEASVSAELEDAAQSIHGLDQVIGADGCVRHESQGGRGTAALSEAEIAHSVECQLRRLVAMP